MKKLIFLGAALLLLAIVTVICYHVAAADAEHEAPPVDAAASAERIAAAAPGWVDAAGGIQRLGVRSDGSVRSLYAVEGAKVEAGALLLQLDDSALRLQLRAAQLELQRQQQLRAAAYEQQQRQQQAIAKLAPLVAQQAEPATELQQLQAQMAELDSGLRLADTAIKAAALNLEALTAQLARLQIHAPAQGEVLRVFARVGDSVVVGTPLLWFVASGPQVVRAELDERLLRLVQPGMRAEVQPEYADGPVYRATVLRLARVVGAVQNLPEPRANAQDDRVVEVVLALEGNELLIGQRVLVRILAN